MQNSIVSKKHYVHCTFVLRSVTYYYINIVIDVIFINQLLRFLEKVNEKSKTLAANGFIVMLYHHNLMVSQFII